MILNFYSSAISKFVLISFISFVFTFAWESNLPNRRQALRSITQKTSAAVTASFGSNLKPAFAQSDLKDGNLIVPSIQLPSAPTGKTKPFPLASFGLQIYDNETAYKLTLVALEAGYRNFFASVLANNQQGFAKAIRDSGIPRDDLYICGTVLSNRVNSYKDAYALTQKGCYENLNVMNKYSNGIIKDLDMIMLDYPAKSVESIRGQWGSFCDFAKEGHVSHLAVSNFSPAQLDICIDNTRVVPTVNQLPFSITNHPKGLMEENTKRGIHVQSWSPLSSTLPRYKAAMTEIGSKYGKSAAQVGLRWIVQNGGSYCVQSKKKEHFVEDLNVFDFELKKSDMERLSDLSPPVGF
jgi:diketogulonate reductase-like aldo/keto reductase